MVRLYHWNFLDTMVFTLNFAETSKSCLRLYVQVVVKNKSNSFRQRMKVGVSKRREMIDTLPPPSYPVSKIMTCNKTRETTWGMMNSSCHHQSLVPAMSFYPDLSQFYPDFIQIFLKFTCSENFLNLNLVKVG
jgi:hypothetical protein